MAGTAGLGAGRATVMTHIHPRDRLRGLRSYAGSPAITPATEIGHERIYMLRLP